MKKEWLVKTLAMGVVVLFFVITVASTIVTSNYPDDTTPPVATDSFNSPYYSSSWSTTEVVSTESTDNSFVSSLWVDDIGTVHVAWHDHTNYGGSSGTSHIFYKYKPIGGSWSTTEVVSTESTSSSEQPSLMVDNEGTIHIAWMDDSNYDGGGYDTYDVFYKYKPAGGSWSITEVVSTESTNYAWWPSLWVDDECTVHVAWEDWTNYGGSGSDTDIFYKYKPSGGSWSTTEVVSTESTGFSEQASLMVDGDGTVHVAWDDGTSYGGSGSDYDIFYKYKSSGGSWSTTEVVSTESTDVSERPSLKVDCNGTVHVAWEDLTDYGGSGSSDMDIFYKYKPSSGSWSTTEVVSTESTDTSWWPSLMVGGDGTVHVSWMDLTNYGGSGSDRDVFYKYKASPLRVDAHGPYYGNQGEHVSFTGSATGGTPPYSWLWDFGDGNTSDEQNLTHVYSIPGNYTIILTVTDDTANSSDDTTWAYIYQENNPPNTPTINGPTSGKTNYLYPYNFSTTDPNDDDVYYYINWVDNTNTDWIGPYNSGTEITRSHSWNEKGIYIIKVKAKDPYNSESLEATLEVTMPRTRVSYNSLFLRFLERLTMLKGLFQILPHASF
jgi:hypothetical protein